MPFNHDPREGCHHNRAPLKRLGKVRHQRSGRAVYVLLCTECGFTVTTDELRRLKRAAEAMAVGGAPAVG